MTSTWGSWRKQLAYLLSISALTLQTQRSGQDKERTLFHFMGFVTVHQFSRNLGHMLQQLGCSAAKLQQGSELGRRHMALSGPLDWLLESGIEGVQKLREGWLRSADRTGLDIPILGVLECAPK